MSRVHVGGPIDWNTVPTVSRVEDLPKGQRVNFISTAQLVPEPTVDVANEQASGANTEAQGE